MLHAWRQRIYGGFLDDAEQGDPGTDGQHSASDAMAGSVQLSDLFCDIHYLDGGEI